MSKFVIKKEQYDQIQTASMVKRLICLESINMKEEISMTLEWDTTILTSK